MLERPRLSYVPGGAALRKSFALHGIRDT